MQLPFRVTEGAPPMLKPIEKPSRQPLVHHPSDVLDSFCHYDPANKAWLDFDESVSLQIIELEFNNRQYIRVKPKIDRRSHTW
jgi:hypothetical protein